MKNCCGKPTTPRTFSVLISTPDPKVYKLKQLNCLVCWECRSVFIAREEKLFSQIVAMGREMSEVLFGG